jgi:mannose-6-phosphate isomerase-like protein (cupin superfamily)
MTQKINRRTLLAYSAGGGAALMGLFGSTAQVLAQQGANAPRGRRIVTGTNAEGKSYIAADEMTALANLWTTKPDQLLGQPPAAEPKLVSKLTGDTRFFVTAIAPSRDPKPNLQNRIGFHKTPGIAYCYVLDGELTFLVDLQEVKVKTGDLIVERATMHSWRNDGVAPVSMAITVVNASA